MSNQIAETQNGNKIEMALVQGDLSKLSVEERLSYYKNVCDSLGVNYLTKPFDYIQFQNGKLVLYATKTCTDQLREKRGISVEIVSEETIGEIYKVKAKATDSQGRIDSAIGAVWCGHLKGNDLANAMMKAETKAKRRATLSICGLGWLDESEVDSVPSARAKQMEQLEGDSAEFIMWRDKIHNAMIDEDYPDKADDVKIMGGNLRAIAGNMKREEALELSKLYKQLKDRYIPIEEPV